MILGNSKELWSLRCTLYLSTRQPSDGGVRSPATHIYAVLLANLRVKPFTEAKMCSPSVAS